jgi:eukaryotic-like serine/threonine-protein kinase
VAENDDIAVARTKAASAPPPASERSEAPPTLLADRYTIIGLLGMGGMGRVYRAHDKKLDEVVALKMLRRELVGQADMLERFRQEVKLARKVTSPHVVRTFDLGEHGDDVFLTMEYVEGHSLAQRIDKGALGPEEVLRVARAVSAGIAAAHATGVLHRDLKPDNVLVAKTGRIAITDFGIARASSTSPLATADRFVGTPAYMAPEQVQGAATIGPAADVYAFGTILFEMLTGRRAFAGNEALAVALARVTEAPPDPRAVQPVPDALAELTLRCLARVPADRYPDGAALEAALAALGPLTPVPGSVYVAPIVPDRSSRLVAILPLRASAELAEVAEGLSEEIVDALSMSRGLRVRPLSALRGRRTDAEARALGAELGVDIVVEGSVRKRGDRVRITARAISVSDDFQLWASHVDAAADGLLAASDDLVRAIARALTVELSLPARPALDGRIAEVYLQSKAHLRAGWIEGDIAQVIAKLEPLLAEAPNDAAIVATLAMALARSGFFGDASSLSRVRPLAERAVALAPSSGEAWLALGFSSLYNGAAADAARAFARAVRNAPGFAMAQALLGSMLLEAGDLDASIAHLEAAVSIEPSMLQRTDLARAYAYAGRHDEATRLLRREPRHQFTEYLIARLELWRGEHYSFELKNTNNMSSLQFQMAEISVRSYARGAFSDEDLVAYEKLLLQAPGRWRATQAQFLAEFLAYMRKTDDALRIIALAVDAGLHDALWVDRCPLLEPLHDHPIFVRLANTVRDRGRAIADAAHTALA